MYKKRLNEWGDRKYRIRQVYADCAQKLEECNREEIILPDEELVVSSVPVKRVGRVLKRKNGDSGRTGNTYITQSPCNEYYFFIIGLTSS
jgi:hypothetical protein